MKPRLTAEPSPRGGFAPVRSSSIANPSGRRGRSARTIARGTMVCRAQQPKSYGLSGNQRGSSTISGGSAARAVRVADPEELAQQQVLRVHRHVRLELALPEALRILEREQVVAGALERR